MKKTLALVLAVVLCAACFAFASSAADALSFLPEADSEVAAEGCEYVINDDGSVTITLTAASAKLTVIYKDVEQNTIYEEKEMSPKISTLYILMMLPVLRRWAMFL